MIAAIIGLLLGLVIGVACRVLDIPLPAPPKLVGALLVLSMTLGYVGADALLPIVAHTATSSETTTP